MMIQEIIPGPDSNIYQCMVYIDGSGQIRARFMMRKLRQNPPQFGVARVAVSCQLIALLVDYTTRMARSIGFTGIWATEFKLDARDGQFKLIEINGRMPRWNWLAAYCGVNIPWLAYCDAHAIESVQQPSYETDVHWIELAKDVSLSIRNHQGEGLDLSEYIEPYLSARKTFADVSSDDYMPFLKRIFNPMTNRELQSH
ncbi:MAG TPA: hypothetical protein VHD56_16560 [Tepidisphaeraceae bacterium]|nr:hypothetical protein [Tepidisphaeraceae bacterium]